MSSIIDIRGQKIAMYFTFAYVQNCFVTITMYSNIIIIDTVIIFCH